ncbi:hypothetical protein P4U99_12030 [Brevibacillus agri]|nr:hypothetical protein [Brevibacillus agri]MCG5253210.1 hypothetical protein [Brevibacillus agri]MED1643897.1 hypothetical protein [Brevibacillus agri]MED1654558.1 hypothetical protein [Brevibacillus agri]MED1686107.1 hypothetical protein [Brevibacillus agri]MED1690535.1 hypothetical protein [Brevibacillus agri]
MTQIEGESSHNQQQHDHFPFPPCSLTTASQNWMSAKNALNASPKSNIETKSIRSPSFFHLLPVVSFAPSSFSGPCLRLPTNKIEPDRLFRSPFWNKLSRLKKPANRVKK